MHKTLHWIKSLVLGFALAVTGPTAQAQFTDRMDGAIASLAIKAPCRVATTSNITLSGLQTIDGVTVATMQNHPFSLTTTTSTASSANFGPTVNAVPVTSNIGIQLRFSLTAGDTAAILSRCDVTVIPEPASAAACVAWVGTMLVLSGTISRRRRRHA